MKKYLISKQPNRLVLIPMSKNNKHVQVINRDLKSSTCILTYFFISEIIQFVVPNAFF